MDQKRRGGSPPARPPGLTDPFSPAPFPRSLARAVKHGAKRSALSIVDRGWLGLRPLEKHVVVCGFPRSGSTLLLMMCETCVEGARFFGREVLGLQVASTALRNHPIMITKRPDDVYFIDELRRFYARRRSDAHFVLTVRDPRAVLTSRHSRFSRDEYYVTPERWRSILEHVRYQRGRPDVTLVEFAELVTDPAVVQERLTRVIGWKVKLPFAEAYAHASPEFDTGGLGEGALRPADRGAVDRWRADADRDRIRQLLAEMPDLPEVLIELGYETDESWVRDYRS